MKARTIPVPDSPETRFDSVYHDDPCFICGREVKKPRYWAHVVDGGANFLHKDDESLYVDDGGDMYLHPIGPSCAKKIPKEYLHT
jgi:hypothetical protein